MWATQMGDGAVTGLRAGRSAGRSPRPDIEPVNWIQAEFARRHERRRLRRRPSPRRTRFRRDGTGLVAPSGWDLCCCTPTARRARRRCSTEFDPVAGDPAGADAAGRRTWVVYTPPFNMSGQPAISLPLHWNDAGLPIGVQLVAAYGRRGRPGARRATARGRPPLGRPPPGPCDPSCRRAGPTGRIAPGRRAGYRAVQPPSTISDWPVTSVPAPPASRSRAPSSSWA